MPHVTTRYRVIVRAGHHRQPRNATKWLEPYPANEVEAIPGTALSEFAPPQLGYTDGGEPATASFLFWSVGDGTNGQSSTAPNLSTTVGTTALTLVAWYLPVGSGPGNETGYVIDAFSDALNDFVDDDFVEVSPDAALTGNANVVGWVPTAHAEELKAVPGIIHTGESFEHWIGGHPTDDVDDLSATENGYAVATYHRGPVVPPRPADERYELWVEILWGIINDAPGAVRGPNGGPVPVDPGWGALLRRATEAALVASAGARFNDAAELRRIAVNEVQAAVKELGAALEAGAVKRG